MQLSYATILALLPFAIAHPSAHSAPKSHAGKRAPACKSSGSNICDQLIAGCVGKKSASSPWSQSVCVAAATCSSVGQVLDSLRCNGQSVSAAAKLPVLDYNVYASIVGQCAWAPGGCSITSQNYIDLIYSSLTQVKASNWPSSPSAITSTNWAPIVSWAAAQNSAIPWTNFNDWLHYSTDLSPIVTPTSTKVTSTSSTSTTSSKPLTATTTISYSTFPVSIVASRTTTVTYTSQINPTQAVVIAERQRIYNLQAGVNGYPVVYTIDGSGNTVGTSSQAMQATYRQATTTLKSNPKTSTINQIAVSTSVSATAGGFLAGSPILYGSFIYTSCWTDSGSPRALNQLLLTGASIESCAAAASKYAYFGLEYGTECWAANTLTGTAAPETSCNMKCLSNPSQTCGGIYMLNLYTNTQIQPVVSRTSTSAPAITTPQTTKATTSTTTSKPIVTSVPGCKAPISDLMCNDLLSGCVAAQNLANPWSQPACVAAATCAGSGVVLTRLALCLSGSAPAPASLNMDSGVFSSMTKSDSTMSQQEYIDFMYGQLTAVGASNWPTSGAQLASNYWLPMVSWTATGATVPLSNFQDYLRYYTTAPSGWTLSESHSGSTFFNGWNAWGDFGVGGNDPTHGVTNYVDMKTAWNQGLISINSAGNAVMKVDTTPYNGGLRNAMRIQSVKKYNVGTLAIFDVVHAPQGVGTWPAIWSYGDNWPYQGEIDIYETVNDQIISQTSYHSSGGCSMDVNASPFTGVLTGSANCDSFATANSGCGIRDTGVAAGKALNAAGGSVMVMAWTASGINTWFFPRNAVPQDITSGSPVPSGWGKPVASLGSSQCDLGSSFNQHSFVINTALCGDWANGAWPWAQYENGENISPAAATGYGDCPSYIANNGAALKNAYWEIASVKIYTQNS